MDKRLAEDGARWDALGLVERRIAGQRAQQLDTAQGTRSDEIARPGAEFPVGSDLLLASRDGPFAAGRRFAG